MVSSLSSVVCEYESKDVQRINMVIVGSSSVFISGELTGIVNMK
jgi:hypothetical protein